MLCLFINIALIKRKGDISYRSSYTKLEFFEFLFKKGIDWINPAEIN